MPLGAFELARPRTVAEAAALLAEAGAEGKPIAGGTDLLVNLKQRREAPRLLVALGGLEELRGRTPTPDGGLRLGAGESLADLARDEIVRERAPALARACAKVAHPQVREMGTLGGNLCLDVRCRYVNRSAEWRGALGGCLKAEGDRCHVVEGAQRCVAAVSADTVAPLVALGAVLEIAGPAGARRLPVAALYGKDGREPLALAPGEIIAALLLPSPPPRRRSAYHKWAVRRAIDFPLVSVAMICDSDGGGAVATLRVAVSVLGPRPKLVPGLERYAGRRLDAALAAEVAKHVTRRCVPLPNVLYDPGYRRRLLGTLVRRQIEAWAS